jgi:hypothetical protein
MTNTRRMKWNSPAAERCGFGLAPDRWGGPDIIGSQIGKTCGAQAHRHLVGNPDPAYGPGNRRNVEATKRRHRLDDAHRFLPLPCGLRNERWVSLTLSPQCDQQPRSAVHVLVDAGREFGQELAGRYLEVGGNLPSCIDPASTSVSSGDRGSSSAKST